MLPEDAHYDAAVDDRQDDHPAVSASCGVYPRVTTAVARGDAPDKDCARRPPDSSRRRRAVVRLAVLGSLYCVLFTGRIEQP